jgi:hypothetical protein
MTPETCRFTSAVVRPLAEYGNFHPADHAPKATFNLLNLIRES